MGMTMVEKILARHAGLERVQAGDVVVCEVDVVVVLDMNFLNQTFPTIPLRIKDPGRIAVVLDHTVPAPNVSDASAHAKAREFVRKFGIERFYDVGRHGICHQVAQENGLALPGQILACSDSHTSAAGAFNCAARGLGLLEIISIMCTGKTWYKASPTIKVTIEGEKPPNVFGKDVFLALAGRIGSVEGHNLEFAGPGLQSLGMDDRATLATMCVEMSANFATFPADGVLFDYLAKVTDHGYEPVAADPDAAYAAAHTIDLSELEPMVAKPDFIPNNTCAVGEAGERQRIDQAFIGSCANGKLEDLRIAAEIVRGRQVAPGVRLIVTPASQLVYRQAVKLGYVETLLEAGAVVTNSTCGACAGMHMGVLAPGEVCITSSTRNFKGRMGSADAKIYMGSSATVAASAVTGYITDPTPFLKQAGVA